MNIVVPFKMVPDLVDELNVDELGTGLDTAWLRLIISEFDDHAIEQAILLKEQGSAQVTVLGPETEGVEYVLFTAAAKGADRLIRFSTSLEARWSSHALAQSIVQNIRDLQPDLILTGVQAHTDLDGSLGPLLAERLGMPYVGYVSGVEVADGTVRVKKEYPGGLAGEMEVRLPAVLGIQAAARPPRYVAVSKVRESSRTAKVEQLTLPDSTVAGRAKVLRMFKPEVASRAQMIEGSPGEVADRLLVIFKEIGVL